MRPWKEGAEMVTRYVPGLQIAYKVTASFVGSRLAGDTGGDVQNFDFGVWNGAAGTICNVAGQRAVESLRAGNLRNCQERELQEKSNTDDSRDVHSPPQSNRK